MDTIKDKRVARLREHRTALNKILRDERLSPDRRVLASCLALWLDAASVEDQQFLRSLMEGVWVKPKRWKWDDDSGEPQSLLEQQTVGKLKGVFDAILEGDKKP